MIDGPDFEEFASIPRLFRNVWISEKLDDTNAQIWVPEHPEEPPRAGSRNRWITVEADNFGFARWVAEHAEELRALGPGRHFGEWWGQGVQRGYGLKEKRFSLFNAARWRDTHRADPMADANAPKRVDAPECCHVVPVLYVGPLSDAAIHACLEHLKTDGSRAAPNFMNPEGVVVFHEPSQHLYKVTLGGDGHKGQKGRAA